MIARKRHLRELQRAWEQDGQAWAQQMQDLLLAINQAVAEAGGCLPPDKQAHWRNKYRKLIEKAQIQCPPPDESQRRGKRGRLKRSKARNLLERLQAYEQDILRFMTAKAVPFTNNQGENDIRMTKVQQKISGCFRSMQGARIFCRISSYLSTVRSLNCSQYDKFLL